jgi:hypothetical protein
VYLADVLAKFNTITKLLEIGGAFSIFSSEEGVLAGATSPMVLPLCNLVGLMIVISFSK